MALDDFSADARLLIEFGKETRAKNASLQGDMPTLTQQYEVKTQSIAELTQAVAEANLRLKELQEEAKGLEDGSDRVKSLIAEHNTALNQEGDAALRLRDAEELAIALKGEINRLIDEGNSSVATQDMSALTQSYEAAIARVAELVERVAALDLRTNQIGEEGKGLGKGSITRRVLSEEYKDVMSDLCLARFRLDGAKKRVANLKGGIELLNKCLAPRKRSAVEVYLCTGTSEDLAAAQVENSELLALMKAALAASE